MIRLSFAAFLFGCIGAALAVGLVWFAAYIYGETVPAWGYALAFIFGHSDFYDAVIYARREHQGPHVGAKW